MRGRPRKPSAIREAEGNRSRTPIPKDLPLHGTPELPDLVVGDVARDHFRFLAAEFGGAGVLKRADAPALAKLADLWRQYWEASQAGEVKLACALSAAWDRAASRLGIQVVDRIKLMIGAPEKPDEIEEIYLKVSG